MPAKPLYFGAIALLLSAGQVSASEAIPTVGQLSQIQAQTMLLEAEAKRAAAKALLLKNKLDAGEDIAALGGQQSESIIASDLPTVTGISTMGGRLYATFRYQNGTSSRASAGEIIPGNFKVTEISLERAVVTKGDRRIPLQTGVASPAPNGASQPTGSLPGQYIPSAPSNRLP